MDRKEWKLITAVRDHMEASLCGTKQRKVIAAVSGGADSMCLLEILSLLAPQMGFALLVAHVNHGIRGKEADGDAEFVRGQCVLRKLPFFVRKEDVPALARMAHLSEEEAGRRVRYAFFQELLQKEGAGRIATAHHSGDVAETFLFHLCRGSGLQGLSGIAGAEGMLIRPLIHISRQEIEQFLKKREIPFVEDATNRDRKYTRNRIRREVLPFLETEIHPRAQEHILQTAAQIASVQSYLREQARKLFVQAKEETCESGWLSLRLSFLEREPDFLRREVYLLALESLSEDRMFGRSESLLEDRALGRLESPVEEWKPGQLDPDRKPGQLDPLLEERKPGQLNPLLEDRTPGRKDITRRHLEAVDLLGRRKESGGELQLPAGVVVRKEYGSLFFFYRRKQEEKSLPSGQSKKGEEGGLRLQTEELEKGEVVRAAFHEYRITAYTDFSYERDHFDRYTNCFDYAIIKGTVFFRYRKEGDFFSLDKEGSRHKEIRKWMTDEKIPARIRDKVLLMADGNRVLWIPGYRTDAEVWEKARQAGRYLHIRIEKEINGREDQRTDFE